MPRRDARELAVVALAPVIARWSAGALALAAVAGCGDNDLGIQRRRPNRPPETVLSGRPPGGALGTDHRVHLFWTGYDADGAIDHFDYILVDHPAQGDSGNAVDSLAAGRFVGAVPAADDPRWTSITVRDSLFATRADSLPRPPQPGPGETNEFVRRQSFQRWHTFFVRAVDDAGAVDLTPDYASFNATTLAPTVALEPPIAPGYVFHAPPTIVFRWKGEDPLGDEISQPPIASRWVLLPTRRNTSNQYVGFPDSLYHLAPALWSPWRAWDSSDGSGQRAVAHDLPPADASRPGSGFYIFAVQAMDEAGAVTPVFDDATAGKNNAARVFVSGFVGPTLVLQDPYLGTYTFIGSSAPVTFDVAASQPLRFAWRADGSSYGGSITGYRYGWDIRELDDDESWEQGWSETATRAPGRVFASGVHRFYLQVRDDAGTVTRAVLEVTVRTVTRRRALLLVDDTVHARPELEEGEDSRWTAVLDSVAHAGGFVFDRGRDVYDVASSEYHSLPPPITLVFDYQAIVWAVVSPTRGSSLREIAGFFDPFVERNRNRVGRYNYLSVYIENGGRLWVCGTLPAHSVWPVGDRPIAQQLPVNVVNWDDYAEPHPGIDSVGVPSFLYRMGVEAFDVGGGGRAAYPRRDRLEHSCLGLRRALPSGAESRRFASSAALGHVHFADVATADVEAAAPGERQYTTTPAAGHVHQLALGAADFQALRRGARLELATATAATPVVHAHGFVLADPFGLWGAPPALESDAGWPVPPDGSLNPMHSRPNIEIYNMPRWVASQVPPLAPDPELVVAPYVYASGVVEGSTASAYYPSTADGQPALVFRKVTPADHHFARAFCGFEPWLLRFDSHRRLAEYVLLQEMHLGEP